METIFTSNQYNVAQDQLSEYFSNSVDDIKELNLSDVSILPSGHGHYSIKAKFEVDGNELEVKTKTSNMQLIDAWKSGMNDNYEDGEDGFDNWDEVVESMLIVIDVENSINN